MQNACGLVAVVVLAKYPAANLEPSADDKEVRTGKMLVGGQDKPAFQRLSAAHDPLSRPTQSTLVNDFGVLSIQGTSDRDSVS